MNLELQAAMHGLKLDTQTNSKRKEPQQAAHPDQDMMFLAPEDYEKMSPEERKRRTEKMLGFYKGYAGANKTALNVAAKAGNVGV